MSNTLLICICMPSQLATYSSHRWVRKFRGLWYEQHNDLCMLLKCCGKAQTLNAWHVLRGWMQVIAKLSDGKASHVPYRDSKLTRLLQSSLSGHGQISVGFLQSSHSDLQLHLCCACLNQHMAFFSCICDKKNKVATLQAGHAKMGVNLTAVNMHNHTSI